jgi:hypothetical protein
MPRRRAVVRRVTGFTRHTAVAVLPVGIAALGDMADPAYVEIVDGEGGFYLNRYATDGAFITDTWHETLDKAMEQAQSEFEIAEEDWVLMDDKKP